VLKLATLGIALFVGALIAVPALGFMIAPAFLDQGAKAHDLGPLADFPQGEFVWTTFTADPAQGAVSRRSVFVRSNGLIAGQPSFTILSGRSSYLGCPVQPNGVVSGSLRHGDVTMLQIYPKGFGSACHPGTQYDTEGRPVGGPTTRPLDRYSYSIRNGQLFIGSPYSVSQVDGTGATAKIHAVPFALPGEPVSGLESWLYPIHPAG
jgi:Rieske Fe-S protein